MAARLSFVPERPSTTKGDMWTRSDVWSVRPSLRPRPGPAEFAIHDAKNMLGVLSANVEVLRRALACGALPAGVQEALGDIDESARRLSGLLREALSGLQGHDPEPPPPSSTRVASIVESVVGRMAPAASASGVRMVVARGDEAYASIAPQLLERVLENLLENAVRFSNRGDTVEVEYTHRGGRTILAVSDRGPGVDDAARDAIFESYRRRAPLPVESHYGLGLAFCRQVARAHGGDAWVFNRTGGGACFVFETE
jgi:signal transduction histidine kinase